MNILFLTIAFPNIEADSNLYSDLMLELHHQGHSIFIMTCNERRYKAGTEIKVENGLNILRIRTGNLQKTNLIEKGISTLLIEYQYLKALKGFWNDIKFDLVIYSTPPITFGKVVRYIKNKYSSKSYLLLKDIFPQNAVDIGIMKESGLIHKHFRKKEKALYKYSDFIGCMSPANVEYIINQNPEVDPRIVEVCPNSIYPSYFVNPELERISTREKYKIPQDTFVCIYGGNLGKPQGIDFLMEIAKSNRNIKDVFFVIAGSGTEYNRLCKFIEDEKIFNIRVFPHMNKDEFTKLVLSSDCGLIFLDKRFTIPNVPSRMLSYMDCSKPILAATDKNTDIGNIITEGNFGFWSESGDLCGFNNNLQNLAKNSYLCRSMGINSRNYLLDNYKVSITTKIILRHFS